jgi:hypothetical protein
VISTNGASWASRRAEAHPATPPPMIATRTRDGEVTVDASCFAAAAEDIAVVVVKIKENNTNKRVAGSSSTPDTILSSNGCFSFWYFE